MLPKATSQTRITARFNQLRSRGQRALVGYLTAGDPSPDKTPELVTALERGGVDLIELGVPFSDPVADGPVIQRASERALRQGTTVKLVLEIARQIRRRSEIPLLLFSYLNPLLSYGFERLVRDAAEAGIDGLLVTDLTVEEADPFIPLVRNAGLDTVFLAAPTSTRERLGRIAQYSTGFVYVVSRTGVTGERQDLSDAIEPLVRQLRELTPLPIAVGFGISRPEHVRAVGQIADAAVVGSAFVRLVEQLAGSEELLAKLEEMARTLKSGFNQVETTR